jgi:hypothetical protein
MLSDAFYEKVLIEPILEGADKIRIISGYATSAMAFHYLNDLKNRRYLASIDLIIGMCVRDGLSLSNHNGFKKLVAEESEYSRNFKCSYIYTGKPVHSKIYAWFRGDTFQKAFIGSANFTQTAFNYREKDILSVDVDETINDYLENVELSSIYCNHTDAESLVTIYNDKEYYKNATREELEETEAIPGTTSLPKVVLSLLDRRGELPGRSGLNWGQRPELGREPNQAYIRIPSEINRTDFFPERPIHFTVNTDDGKVLYCARAQDEGKAIQTPYNNSLLGEYFRNRLGLPNGAKVTKEDLLRYGRTDVVFYKIDDETYYMDFSVLR